MTWQKNDPRLIVYSLNELSPSERSEVEAALRVQPELRRELAEIERASGVFKDAFRSEVRSTLTLAQRGKVLGQVSQGGWRKWSLVLGGFAAGMASVLLYIKTTENVSTNELAMAPSSPPAATSPPPAEEEVVPAAPPKRERQVVASKRKAMVAQKVVADEPELEGVSAGADMTVAAADVAEYEESTSEMADAAPAMEAEEPPVARASLAKKASDGRRAEGNKYLSVQANMKIPAGVNSGKAKEQMNLLEPELQKCLKARIAKPGFPGGKLSFKIATNPDSETRVTAFADTLGDDSLKSCFQKAIQTKVWPTAFSRPAIYELTLKIVSE